MRSMVEGYVRVVLTSRRWDHSPVPLHHFVVPLPVRGGIYFALRVFPATPPDIESRHRRGTLYRVPDSFRSHRR
jgi:hypothetical protein